MWKSYPHHEQDHITVNKFLFQHADLRLETEGNFNLKAYSQFTFYLVTIALMQASMAEKEEMKQYEDEL